MLTFKMTPDQRRALGGLAYWIADAKYIRERYGDNDPELQITDDTIKSLFHELDALGVPYWVQNTVIGFAEDWRRYHGAYIEPYLAARNIVPA